jgi:hypothetical protein
MSGSLKTLYFTFLFLFLLSCGEKHKQEKPDLVMYGYKGPVRSVLAVSRDSMNGQERKVYFYVFDRKGNKILYIDYNHGEESERDSLKYNEKEQLVEEDHYDTHGLLKDKMIYSYNWSGNCIRMEVKLAKDEPYHTVEYTYDANGNVVEVRGIDPGHDACAKKILTYDERGNNTSVLIYKDCEMDSLMFKIEYKYDTASRLIEQDELNKGIRLTGRFTLAYDLQGRQVWERHFDGDGKPYQSYKNIFKDNKLIGMEEGEDTAVDRSWFTLDKSGNTIHSETVRKGRTVELADKKIDYY